MSCSNYQKNKYKNEFKNPINIDLSRPYFVTLKKKKLMRYILDGAKNLEENFSKIMKVAFLAMLIFNSLQPVSSTRAMPLAVMNIAPQDRGPVPPSKPDPRTYLPAPSLP